MEEFSREQVIIPINGSTDLSVVSINGKPEVAIVGPEGVYQNTQAFITTAEDLLNYLQTWIGKYDG